MAAEGRQLARLGRNLLLTVLVGVAVYAAFEVGEATFGPLPPLQFQLVEAGTVVLLGFLVTQSFTSAIRGVLRSERTARHSVVVVLFVDALVGVAVVLALLHIFGVSLESVFLGSAFAAIVVGLASQTVLANIFAGFMIVLGRPFVVGQRVSLISGNYAVIWPSYPHEMGYPVYTGVVEDIELLYTVLRLDDGRQARVPSSVALGAMVVRLEIGEPYLTRVRVTLPHSVAVGEVEAALASIAGELAPAGSGLPAPRLEVADIGTASWDAVAVVWTREPRPEPARDRVLRRLLEVLRLGGASAK